jgi:hypothetical protein
MSNGWINGRELSLLYNGNGIPDNFKKYSLFFYDKYKSLQKM